MKDPLSTAVKLLSDQRVTTPDGVSLATDIYLPERAGNGMDPIPAVLERTPYGRTQRKFSLLGRYAVARGYAFVIQDTRGRGDSGGVYHLLTNENDDGLDGATTVEWLHGQQWFDGRLATIGGSGTAANQQSLATNTPKGLRVQVLRDCGTNYYRRMFRQHGAFNVGMVLPWIAMQAPVGKEAQADADVAHRLEKFRDDLGQWVPRLPLKRGQSPLALAPEYEQIYFTMAESGDDAPYWDTPTARLEGRWSEYPRDVAVLLISGWFSHHCAANFDKFAQFTDLLNREVALIVGPWIHSGDLGEATSAGDVEFGQHASIGPNFDLWFDWIDLHISGDATTESGGSPIRYFLMGTGDGHRTDSGKIFHGGEWRNSTNWPPAGNPSFKYYLASDGRLTEGLSQDVAPNATTQYDFDPHSPCPSIGGTNVATLDFPAFVRPGPRDQRCDDGFAACTDNGDLSEREDVVSFRTAVLQYELDVVGPVTASFWVSSSAIDTDFVVKLIDEYPESDDFPNGFSMLVAEGIQRMRYRADRPIGELLVPDEIYQVDIEVNPTANRFKPGHRLRVDVTSSSFPAYDVNPNSGEAPGADLSNAVTATQTLYHDSSHPSHIQLSVLEASVPPL